MENKEKLISYDRVREKMHRKLSEVRRVGHFFDRIKDFMNLSRAARHPHQCGGCVPMRDFLDFEKIELEEPIFFHHIEDDNLDYYWITMEKKDQRSIRPPISEYVESELKRGEK